MNIEKLASFRVDHGNGGYRTLEMTKDEQAARRRFILGVLRNYYVNKRCKKCSSLRSE